MSESKHAQRAGALFREGYNCAQSVFCAFCDVTGMEFETAARLSSSFGGGMGRLREVCGAVTGIFMVAGILYGYESPQDDESKAAHYARIQWLAERFKQENGTIICRELLGLLDGADSPVPSARTEQYYHTRPCEEYVRYAAELMDELIQSKQLEEIR